MLSLIQICRHCQLHPKNMSLTTRYYVIKDFLNKFVNPFGIYPFNTFGTTDYFPHLLKLRAEEISNCLYDIYKMAEGLMFFLRRTDDVDIFNRVVRILYTFNYYFTSVIESHLEFAQNKDKPQTVWRVR